MLAKITNRPLWIALSLILVFVGLPYLFAALSADQQHVFAGFLLNPLDGNSYLAKMRQGYNGSWQFTLPYTSEPGEGAYLFVFYLFLGHVARFFGSSLLLTFHIMRLISAVLLIISLYHFFAATFNSKRTQNLAFFLAAFGSGMGWLTLPFLEPTSDLWVAEAYPFLSAYANPHFALGLALQLWLLTSNELPSRRDWIKIVSASLILAAIAPFAVPVVIVVLGGQWLWRLYAKESARSDFLRLMWIGLGAAPVLLYDLWIIYSHPILSGWNAQNLTPSPPLWDLIISLSPALLLALVGVRHVWKSSQPGYRVLMVWLVLCMLLLYVPFNLQRRFLTGFFVPVAGMAAVGLEQLASKFAIRFRWLVPSLFALSLPTNLIILAIAVFGIQTQDSHIYLYTDESLAFAWVEKNLPPNSLILAAPDTGLFLPAYTSARVIYGHPFETLDAQANEAVLNSFFTEWSDAEIATFLLQNHIDYIFIGPRERELGAITPLENWRAIYETTDVTIYKLDQ